MKRILLFMSVLAMALTSQAQIKTPAPSPSAKMMQTIGLTDVTVEYSRPSMRDRVVFGNLVPYGKVWRTGANANTKITFSEDVVIGGQEVKAGTYSIYTKPMENQWEIMLYSDANNWGVPQNWDETKIVAKQTVDAQTLPMDVESFTIMFDDVSTDSSNLAMMWENTYVALPIQTMTDAMVMADIDAALNGPSAADYYAAAVYYNTENKDIDKAKLWMEKAMSMTDNPRFWQLRQQSLIYANAGDKDKAIATAKLSLEKAKEAGNDDYVKMNKDSLKEWGAM